MSRKQTGTFIVLIKEVPSHNAISRLYLWICALVVLGLTIFQSVLAYNPVPVWDMQEGYLGFFSKLYNGHWQAWFEPHNEHRIFLQRIIFFIDNYAFGGISIFAIVANFICISINIFLFYMISRDRNAGYLFLPLLICWLFLLTQGENITWAFQAQFHLAYTVPLAGLWILAVDKEKIGFLRCFGAVCAGFLSIGTMGNGILALPLYVVYAIIVRFPLRYVIILVAGLGVEVAFLLLAHRPGSTSLSGNILAHIDTIIPFTFRLLGSPFYHLLGASNRYWVAEIFGVIYLLLLSVRFLFLLFRPKFNAVVDWALIVFCAYVAMSYAGASVSRSHIGMDVAVTTHYTTPSLLGWAALAILYSDVFRRNVGKILKTISLVIFTFVTIGYQYSALSDYADPFFKWKVAFLGLSLGVDDQVAQRTLTSPDFFRQIKQYSEPAYQSRIGYFQAAPFAGIRDRLGKVPLDKAPVTDAACLFSPFQTKVITDSHFLRFSSSIEIDANSSAYPNFLSVQDSEGRELGFALIQSGWRDLRYVTPVNGKLRLPVEGYLSSAIGKDIRAVAFADENAVCAANTTLPPQPFTLAAPAMSASLVTLPIGQVVNTQEIKGGDGSQSNLCMYGLKVLGTYGANGDSDTGKIQLILKEGQEFLYRSGPTSGNQFIEVDGGPKILLPQSLDWVALTLDKAIFGGMDTVSASISDAGSSWGEWSAIAARTPDNQCRPSH